MTTTIETRPKDDAEIQASVVAEIAHDSHFRPAEVGVEVDDGVVTLTGTVSTYAKLVAAADIAADVSGVKGVANELVVRAAKPFVREDPELVEAVRNALEWDVDVPDDRIEVIVRNGRVTLKGTVDYWYERRAAIDATARLSGVVAVQDHLVVKRHDVADADIAADIEATIARRTGAATRVSVEVVDGLVTLRGRTLTFHERSLAERAAWSTKGVRSVSNKIAVGAL